MPNMIKKVARLFSRSRHPVVARLYSHGINSALCVHPGIGEMLLGAYAEGAVESPGAPSATAGAVAVINISGALVNRPMPDICGDGPISYELIRYLCASARDDSNVSATVLRLDTPGGMGAGLFDLTDWISANAQKNGGKKPIVACIDDMAYSAGYAIASACDEVWVSRTGGAGSIGTVCYHIDASAYDAKEGFKVTYIFSGKHKVDGNQHEPLPDAVKNRFQAECDKMRDLFVASVAKYRGMDAAAVYATEADCYTGQAAIDAGLADNLGTLENVLTKLASPATAPAVPMQESSDMPDTTTPAEGAAAAVETPEQLAAKEAAAAAATPDAATLRATVMDALAKAALSPDLIVALQKSANPVAADKVDERVQNAKAIADACAAAKLQDCAAGYVERDIPLDQVRKELIAAVATQGPEVSAHLATKGDGVATSINSTSVYARRRAAAAGGQAS